VQVALADGGITGLLGPAQRWQEQSSQDGDDGDDHQKLDEREASAVNSPARSLISGRRMPVNRTHQRRRQAG
jgi:hypothetical protein